MNRQLGLSLVETMIAIAISILLMAGAISVVASIKNTNKVNDALSSSQEIGRFALNVLTDAISRSGYYGCLQPITYTPQEEASLSASELQGRFYINPVAAFSSDNLSKTSLRGFGVSSANVWTPDPINAPYHQDVQKLKSAAFPPKKDSDVISVLPALPSSAGAPESSGA